MFDRLPYLNLTEKDTEGQISQIVNYLIQLREELEFALSDIGAENLSDSLNEELTKLKALSELNSLQADSNTQLVVKVKKTNKDVETMAREAKEEAEEAKGLADTAQSMAEDAKSSAEEAKADSDEAKELAEGADIKAQSAIDSIPAKLSDLEDDIVAGNYLALLGGGTVKKSADSPLETDIKGGEITVSNSRNHISILPTQIDMGDSVTLRSGVIEYIDAEGNVLNALFPRDTKGEITRESTFALLDDIPNKLSAFNDDIGIANTQATVSAIANLTSSNGTAKSIAKSTGTSLASFTLAGGHTYLIIASARFAKGTAGGGRRIQFSSSEGQTAGQMNYTTDAVSTSNTYTYLTLNTFISPTTDTTYHLNAWQDSDATLSSIGYLRALRLK